MFTADSESVSLCQLSSSHSQKKKKLSTKTLIEEVSGRTTLFVHTICKLEFLISGEYGNSIYFDIRMFVKTFTAFT